MPISIVGTGSITGLSAGGLPDNSIVTADIADSAVTYAKLSTSATESDNVAKRTAKAWVNFNGTGTVAIRDDFNISTIGDDGTGRYTVNFSSNMANSNYAVFVDQSENSNWNTTSIINYQGGTQAPSVSSFKIEFQSGASLVDPTYVSALVFGG